MWKASTKAYSQIFTVMNIKITLHLWVPGSPNYQKTFVTQNLIKDQKSVKQHSIHKKETQIDPNHNYTSLRNAPCEIP